MDNSKIPEKEDIKSLMTSMMTGENIHSVSSMPKGDQNFFYAITTVRFDYIFRMTSLENKSKFESAIVWKHLLLPIGNSTFDSI